MPHLLQVRRFFAAILPATDAVVEPPVDELPPDAGNVAVELPPDAENAAAGLPSDAEKAAGMRSDLALLALELGGSKYLHCTQRSKL